MDMYVECKKVQKKVQQGNGTVKRRKQPKFRKRMILFEYGNFDSLDQVLLNLGPSTTFIGPVGCFTKRPETLNVHDIKCPKYKGNFFILRNIWPQPWMQPWLNIENSG